jgi:hypothetical protein
MRAALLLVCLVVVAACGLGSGTNPVVVEPAFNGSFEDPKVFPDEIVIDDQGTLFRPYPSNIPSGWTIDPAPAWPQDPTGAPRNSWHNGIHARYGIGVFPQPPDPRVPGVPNAVSLFVSSCDTAIPTLCDYPFVVRSSVFDVTGGTRYELRLWYRSFVWWASTPQPHAFMAGVRWLTASGVAVGNPLAELAPNMAPRTEWTEAVMEFVAPATAERAQVVLRIEKHNRDLYIDGIRLVPVLS